MEVSSAVAQAEAPVILRRDLRGLLLYWVGAPAAVYLITGVLLVLGLVTGVGIGVGPAVILGFFCVLCSPWFFNRTVIDDGVVSSGIRWFPKEIPLADIDDVYLGKIWVFGGQVRGLRVALRDGTQTGLPTSAWMGDERLTEWKRAIRSAIEG